MEQVEAKLNGVVMNAVIDIETKEEVDMVEEDVVEIEVIEVEDLINNLVDKLVHWRKIQINNYSRNLKKISTMGNEL